MTCYQMMCSVTAERREARPIDPETGSPDQNLQDPGEIYIKKLYRSFLPPEFKEYIMGILGNNALS